MVDQKVVLVTGCSSGFGYLTALKFARDDYRTFASMRNLESQGAKDLWEIKNKENLPLELLQIDVRSDLSVDEGVQMIVRQTSRIDILINNAGFGYSGPVEEFSIDEVKSQYETNVYGVLRMVKAVAPLMRNQKSGLIINVSSISGLMAFPLSGVYASSKFALEALTEALSFELQHFGICVSLVEPGSFLTNFWVNIRYPQAIKHRQSPYRALTETFFKKMQKVRGKMGGNPEMVVNKIYQISQKKHPALRYRVGWDTNFYWLRKLLPQSLWQWLLSRLYRW